MVLLRNAVEWAGRTFQGRPSAPPVSSRHWSVRAARLWVVTCVKVPHFGLCVNDPSRAEAHGPGAGRRRRARQNNNQLEKIAGTTNLKKTTAGSRLAAAA